MDGFQIVCNGAGLAELIPTSDFVGGQPLPCTPRDGDDFSSVWPHDGVLDFKNGAFVFLGSAERTFVKGAPNLPALVTCDASAELRRISKSGGNGKATSAGTSEFAKTSANAYAATFQKQAAALRGMNVDTETVERETRAGQYAARFAAMGTTAWRGWGYLQHPQIAMCADGPENPTYAGACAAFIAAREALFQKEVAKERELEATNPVNRIPPGMSLQDAQRAAEIGQDPWNAARRVELARAWDFDASQRNNNGVNSNDAAALEYIQGKARYIVMKLCGEQTYMRIPPLPDTGTGNAPAHL